MDKLLDFSSFDESDFFPSPEKFKKFEDFKTISHSVSDHKQQSVVITQDLFDCDEMLRDYLRSVEDKNENKSDLDDESPFDHNLSDTSDSDESITDISSPPNKRAQIFEDFKVIPRSKSIRELLQQRREETIKDAHVVTHRECQKKEEEKSGKKLDSTALSSYINLSDDDSSSDEDDLSPPPKKFKLDSKAQSSWKAKNERSKVSKTLKSELNKPQRPLAGTSKATKGSQVTEPKKLKSTLVFCPREAAVAIVKEKHEKRGDSNAQSSLRNLSDDSSSDESDFSPSPKKFKAFDVGIKDFKSIPRSKSINKLLRQERSKSTTHVSHNVTHLEHHKKEEEKSSKKLDSNAQSSWKAENERSSTSKKTIKSELKSQQRPLAGTSKPTKSSQVTEPKKLKSTFVFCPREAAVALKSVPRPKEIQPKPKPMVAPRNPIVAPPLKPINNKERPMHTNTTDVKALKDSRPKTHREVVENLENKEPTAKMQNKNDKVETGKKRKAPVSKLRQKCMKMMANRRYL